VDGSRATGKEIVVLTLRDLQDGRALCAVTTDTAQVALPADGEFELEFTMELNVQPRLYGLDSSVRMKERRGDIGVGPGAHVQVLKGGPAFEGTVQPNAQVRLRAGSPTPA
jgi:hypothetical protein